MPLICLSKSEERISELEGMSTEISQIKMEKKKKKRKKKHKTEQNIQEFWEKFQRNNM